MLTPEYIAAYRVQTVAILRSAEVRLRAFGHFEQANAMRQFADDHGDDGLGRLSDLVWDSGVFDRHGPPDEGEVPYLVEQSPRLNPQLRTVLRMSAR